ncbi:hypothetical protein, partial [Aureimonas ureilytica]|uniref:hypothetical protein n=1 Tax=Aureimonas ureilytica TaxID=401562 RepID=UPI001AED03B7
LPRRAERIAPPPGPHPRLPFPIRVVHGILGQLRWTSRGVFCRQPVFEIALKTASMLRLPKAPGCGLAMSRMA